MVGLDEKQLSVVETVPEPENETSDPLKASTLPSRNCGVASSSEFHAALRDLGDAVNSLMADIHTVSAARCSEENRFEPIDLVGGRVAGANFQFLELVNSKIAELKKVIGNDYSVHPATNGRIVSKLAYLVFDSGEGSTFVDPGEVAQNTKFSEVFRLLSNFSPALFTPSVVSPITDLLCSSAQLNDETLMRLRELKILVPPYISMVGDITRGVSTVRSLLAGGGIFDSDREIKVKLAINHFSAAQKTLVSLQIEA